jgi:hypothetical protein
VSWQGLMFSMFIRGQSLPILKVLLVTGCLITTSVFWTLCSMLSGRLLKTLFLLARYGIQESY